MGAKCVARGYLVGIANSHADEVTGLKTFTLSRETPNPKEAALAHAQAMATEIEEMKPADREASEVLISIIKMCEAGAPIPGGARVVRAKLKSLEPPAPKEEAPPAPKQAKKEMPLKEAEGALKAAKGKEAAKEAPAPSGRPAAPRPSLGQIALQKRKAELAAKAGKKKGEEEFEFEEEAEEEE